MKLLGLLLTISLLGADAPATRPAGRRDVGVDEFEKFWKEKKGVVLDVRTSKEYQAGHIPGAVNIDINASDFEKKLAGLDKEKTYLVHCASGVPLYRHRRATRGGDEQPQGGRRQFPEKRSLRGKECLAIRHL